MVRVYSNPKLLGDNGAVFKIGDFVEVHLKKGVTSIPDEKKH